MSLLDHVGYGVGFVSSPTTIVFDDPGENGSGHSYVSDKWAGYVGGNPATVLHWARNTEYSVPGMWDAADELDVSWLRFVTNVPVTVRLTRALGPIAQDDVHIYPPHDFSVVDGDLEIEVDEGDQFVIFVGNQTTGGTLQPIAVQGLAPMPEPTGTVVNYDGSQLTTVAGQTLRFTGPAVYNIGQRFPVVANSRVRIDPPVILIGSFHGNGADNITIEGYGSMSGEFSTPEIVRAIDDFAVKFTYSMIDPQASPPAYTIPSNTTVSGLLVFNAPFYSVPGVSTVQNAMLLSPWCSNCDGVHPSSGESDISSRVDNNLIWSGDDAVYIGEDYGAHVVTNNLILASAGANVHLGYWPYTEFNDSISLIVNNDIVAIQSYYDSGSGMRGGHVVVAWSDGEVGEEDHVIDGYEFDEIRVWAPPSGSIGARIIELANHAFPWGGPGPADRIGNIENISFRNFSVEVEPTVKSLISGLDANNTPHDLNFVGVTFDGVELTTENWSRYFETNEFPYNINIGAILVDGQGTGSFPAFSGRGRGTVSRTTFDLDPGHGAQVLVTPAGGKTYKVVNVTKYDGGRMNSFMAPLAKAVVGIFQKTRTTITRIQDVYDSDNDTTVPVSSAISVLASPPIPYGWREVNSSVLATDLRIIVAARELDPLVTNAAFYDLQVRL